MEQRWPTSMNRLVSLVVLAALLASACGSDAAAPAVSPPATEASSTETDVEARPNPGEGAPMASEAFEPTTTEADVAEAVNAFLSQQSSSNATAIVEAIDGNRNQRWVPWLLDLLRLQISNRINIRIGEVLEAITGITADNRIANMITYGSWAQNRELDGGTGYREFKSALYSRIDDRFGQLLESVEDPVELAAIQWGGVPLGGIPELNDPARVPAAEADWMFDDEIILGVVSNGVAVAYPLRILARHELANDTVGGDDLAIVYCTLCRSALVFERDLDGQKLTFLTSGLLLNSNKIMYDLETGSLWHHLRATGIGGPLRGSVLQLRSVNHMRWTDWVAENPDTEVLRLPEPIFFDDPERPPISYDYTPGEAYRSYYDDDELWFPILDTPETFPLKTDVVGIRRNGDAVAFSLEAFTALGESASIEVGGDTLLVESTGAGVRVFDETGGRVITEQSFWFAWHANNPATRTLNF